MAKALDAAAVAHRRRLAVVAGAVSLGAFLFLLAVLTTTVYDGGEICGSPLGSPGSQGDGCRDALAGRWRWAVVFGAVSVIAAGAAFTWRWGPSWTGVRLEDGLDGEGR